MPAINVARTDTFEVQRQKINQIGDQIFNIAQGGSDLSTGNLKLGDGTRNAPSLAFLSDTGTGLFKTSQNVLGFVSNTKKTLDLSLSESVFFTDTIIRKNTIETSGVSITSGGNGYDVDSYSNVALIGGSGSNATATLDVVEYVGAITNAGNGYQPGEYIDVALTGGNGAGAVADITVEDVQGDITDSGSGYVDGSYPGVSLTGGSGAGVTADIDVTGGEVDSVTITEGSADGDYVLGDVLSANAADLGGSGAGFEFTINTNPGIVNGFNISANSDGVNFYSASDVLGIPTAVVGTPSTPFAYTISATQTVNSAIITNGGIGYQEGDTLSVSATDLTSPILYTTTVASTQILSFAGTLPQNTFTEGATLSIVGGEVTSSSLPSTFSGTADQTYNNVSATGGSGTGLVFNFTTTGEGELNIAGVVSSGYNYVAGESVNIPSGSIGGISGVTVTLDAVSSYTDVECLEVYAEGGNIVQIVIEGDNVGLTSPSRIGAQGAAFGSTYEIASVGSANQYFLEDGNDTTQAERYDKDLTFYVGSTYRFQQLDNSNSGHPIALSRTPDGTHGTVSQTGVSVSTGSKNITVSDTTGITPGMVVTVTSGTGVLADPSTVETVVDSTTITLSAFPTATGTCSLLFTGVEYTEGVTREVDYIDLKVTSFTPTLYLYCQNHQDMGGYDNYEFDITVDPNNPKTFGTGFVLTVDSISTSDSINMDIESGLVTASSFTGVTGSIGTLQSNISVTTPLLEGTTINGTSLNSTSTLAITSVNGTTVTGNLDVGSTVQIVEATGNVTTSGELKTNGTFNSSDRLTIQDSNIASTIGNDVVLTPATDRIAKVDTNTSFQIPAGTSAERPTTLAANGAIRFNTDNGQYEGYSAATSSWSSLGGVRDIDGNTYIEAEATTGANDNILYFYNDGNNTLRLTPNNLDFQSVKNISSSKLGLPTYTYFITSQTYEVGDYVRWKRNLYEVTAAGTSGTSGTEPTNTSGTSTSGTADFTWYALAVDDLTFTEIDEIKVDTGTSLVVGGETRISGNTITTDVSDLIIQPNSGQKVQIVATSSLAIPSGQTGQRGTPAAGSIRFNTDNNQYEGYIASSAKWSSLGGVRDVDGNTYIIPESVPGQNENTLFFYNDGTNSMNVTENDISLLSIGSITQTSSLAVECPEVTFNSDSLTIRNDNVTEVTDSFIFTGRDNLDLGHASGLTTNPLLRLTNAGEIKVNEGFGTSTNSYTTVLDETLQLFNLKHSQMNSFSVDLLKGTTNTSVFTMTNIGQFSSIKLLVSVYNQATSDREVLEYMITHNGTDLFYSEFGNVNSGTNLVETTFDIDVGSNINATFTLSSDVADTNPVFLKAIATSIRS